MPINYKQDYRKGFKERSRYIRYVRANNKCEVCGAANGRPHPYKRFRFIVVLATAHLNHNRQDDSEDNLKALCQFCHLKHDKENNMYRRKYGKNYHKGQLHIPQLKQLPLLFIPL